MATTKVLHGRREGLVRATMGDNTVSVLPSGVDAREVTVLQPSDWKRIQDVLSKTNHEAQRQQAVQQEREELHKVSKEMVKNWGNTIEGLRLKKLEARKLKEEREEEEKKLIDLEEAKYQAQKRKESIERAKTLQYNKTDRVKDYHSALLLTNVLRERDAQVKMKKKISEQNKSKDDYFLKLQQKQYEDGVLEDQDRALKRYNARHKISEFQKLQVKEVDQKKVQDKELDLAEGENIMQQVKGDIKKMAHRCAGQLQEMYQAAKLSIEEQRRQHKLALKESHKQAMADRQARLEEERRKDEDEENEIRLFANAKKKMSKMRKEKEIELFNAFQEQTEKMLTKLATENQQKVDDEDDRIAKAVEEREKKRKTEELAKQQKAAEGVRAIYEQRIQMLQEKEKKLKEDLENDRELLRLRVESDKSYLASKKAKKLNKRESAKKLKGIHVDQVKEKSSREKAQVDEHLEMDKKNETLLAKEEAYFQEYAQKVLSEQKAKDPNGNHFPLIKAANEGPGGGRGPKFEGRSGYRPSYLVCDSTGVQLPNYSQETAIRNKIRGYPGKSFKRLGFNW